MSTLSLILLVIGVTGFIGTVLKRGLYGTLITISILMVIIAVALTPFGA